MSNYISRRKFLSRGAVAVSGLALIGVPAFTNAAGKEETVRIGVIGTGLRGKGIMDLIKEIPGIKVTACCDILENNLKKALLSAPKAKGYSAYQELLEDKNIDAIIIATPLYLHYQMVVDALDAGKHVYVEKTMTYDIPQALALVKKMKDSKLTLQVGHQYRYFAMYHKIKEIVSKKWLGTITHFESQYNRNSDWRRPVSDPGLEHQINWRMYKEYSGGLLAELCAHQIDIVNWMLDSRPVKVVGLGGIDFWKDGRETFDNVRTIYEYDNGIKSSVTSILSNEYDGYAMRILGSDGTVIIHRNEAFFYPEAKKKELGIVDGVSGATLETLKKGTGFAIEYKKPGEAALDPTAYALIDFAKCIRNGSKPASDEKTGRDAAVAVHLGNLAVETETAQLWKPEYSI